MDLFSIKSINEILSRHGFRFSKSLGQNFLTERYICEDIVSQSNITKDDSVLEIGPGIGSLTGEIAKVAKKVVAVEIDNSLIPVLDETLAEFNNIKVINSDILKCDLKKLIEDEFDNVSPKVCANLPYYITTPILSYLVESGLFSTITTMIQKEVAERICAKAGTSEYGAFSVYMQYYTEPEMLFIVSADNFIPKPKVQSAVILLRIRETPPVKPLSEELFFKVIKASFAQRRKQLVNSLSSAFKEKVSKEEISQIILKCGFSSTVRGEELTIEDFCLISDNLFDLIQ